MLEIDEFEIIEKKQSHSFIFFKEGPPYCELGWESYKHFNRLIVETLRDFNKLYGVKVYLYEHEIITVEGLFLWGFSFFEAIPEKRDELSKILIENLYSVINMFPQLNGRSIINNHDNGFTADITWAEHYVALVAEAEIEFQPIYRPPKEKSYDKEDFDLGQLKKSLAVSEFNQIIQEHASLNSVEALIYRSAADGFFSNKYRSNKYLREEFLPMVYFNKRRKIPDSWIIKLGIQEENFDAKITGDGHEIIIEITIGAPKNDHLFLSIVNHSNGFSFPLKTMAYLKKERDSLPERIIQAIEKKHKKNYPDQRILMVVVQPEYTYQYEEYVIDEIIKEVRDSVSIAKGNFEEIIMQCGSKIFTLF